MKTKYCEHELILTEESWTSEDEVEVTVKCQLCKIKFKGKLYQR